MITYALAVISFAPSMQLWPANCIEHTAPPYSPLEGGGAANPQPSSIIRCGQQSVTGAVDETGAASSVLLPYLTLYPEVMHILQWCLDHNVILTICSRSPRSEQVEEILRAFGIWDWFLLPQIFNKRKSYHFRNLTDCTGIPFENFLFFDDHKDNVKLTSDVGVTSILVDRSRGFNWAALIEGLRLFSSRQQTRTRNAELNLRLSAIEALSEALIATPDDAAARATVDKMTAAHHPTENRMVCESYSASALLSDSAVADSLDADAPEQMLPRKPKPMTILLKPPPLQLTVSNWGLSTASNGQPAAGAMLGGSVEASDSSVVMRSNSSGTSLNTDRSPMYYSPRRRLMQSLSPTQRRVDSRSNDTLDDFPMMEKRVSFGADVKKFDGSRSTSHEDSDWMLMCSAAGATQEDDDDGGPSSAGGHIV